MMPSRAHGRVAATALALWLTLALAGGGGLRADPGPASVAGHFYVGAALGIGQPRDDGFGYQASPAVSGATRLGFSLLQWLGVEVRAGFLNLSSPVGSPYLVDLEGGPRFGIDLRELRIEPSWLFGYASFAPACEVVRPIGAICYDPSAAVTRVAIAVTYRFADFSLGMEAAKSILLEHGQTWNEVSVTWTFWP
jgi:hypothetical protein